MASLHPIESTGLTGLTGASGSTAAQESDPSTWKDVHGFDGQLGHMRLPFPFSLDEKQNKQKTTETQQLLTRLKSPQAIAFAHMVVRDAHQPANFDPTNRVYADDVLEAVAARTNRMYEEQLEPVLGVVLTDLLTEALNDCKHDDDTGATCTELESSAVLLPDLGVWFNPTLTTIVMRDVAERTSTPDNVDVAWKEALVFFRLDNTPRARLLSSGTDKVRLVLYHVYIQQERTTSIVNTLETQLADMHLGTCPQGRCTRLLQVLSCLE
jgi:hypothetical protein